MRLGLKRKAQKIGSQQSGRLPKSATPTVAADEGKRRPCRTSELQQALSASLALIMATNDELALVTTSKITSTHKPKLTNGELRIVTKVSAENMSHRQILATAVSEGDVLRNTQGSRI